MSMLVFMGTIFLLVMGFCCLKKSINIAAGMNSIWWALFIIMAFILYDTSEWRFTGMLYIEAICVCTLLGSEVGRRIKGINRNNAEQERNSLNHKNIGNVAWLMLLGIVALALLGQLLSLKGYGYSLNDFSSADAYMLMNTQIAYNRYYASSGGVSAITQILLIFSYVSPLCGGYCFVYAKNLKGYLFALSTLVPIIFGMLFTNTKAGFIAAVMLFVAGFIVAYMGKNRCFIKISMKMLVLMTGLVCVMFLALFAVMCIRVGDFSSETIAIIKNKFAEYAVGQMQAFELWFENIRPGEDGFELGSNTFLAIADKLGIKIKVQGVYDLIDGASSNIFTAIRGVITDFGLLGGLLFYWITGMLGGICESRVKNVNGILSVTLVAGMVFFYLYGFIISPWIYTSYILAFVVFYVFCYFSRYRIKCQETKFIMGRTYVKKVKAK